jgi:LacI family transcriptional regulator
MPDIIQIIVQISWDTPTEFEILHGIRDFMRLRPRWALRLERGPVDPAGTAIDARILTAITPGLRRLIGRNPGPVVSVVDDVQADVRVIVDDARVGELAARHLWERGFRHLAFVSHSDEATDASRHGYLQKRYRGFARTAQELGASLAVVPGLKRPSGRRSEAPRWLTDLPKPCGVFCADDHRALVVLDWCRFAGIAVPERIAVVGADNEVLWCETSLPSLSSVAIPWRRIGFEAAAWVDRLLDGRRPPKGGLVTTPVDRVIARQSTDSIAISHPLMVRALAFIRERAFSGISVKAVERATGVNRRQLDRLFLRHLGRTPYDEIRRLQIDRTKDLLVGSELGYREICDATGQSPAYFKKNFLKAVGMSVEAFKGSHGRQA